MVFLKYLKHPLKSRRQQKTRLNTQPKTRLNTSGLRGSLANVSAQETHLSELISTCILGQLDSICFKGEEQHAY